MNAKLLQRLVRAPFLLALAALLGALLLQSSLLRLLDPTIANLQTWVFVGVALALVPALLAAGSPLPATLAVAGPILMAASYGASRLEWLKTLKEFHLGEDAQIAPVRMLGGALVLVLAWALHVVDGGVRLEADARERGIDATQARAARRVVWQRGARNGGMALAVALALGLLGVLAATILPGLFPAQGVSFIAPLAAAALLGVAALLVLGVRKKDAPPTADDSES